MGQQQLLLLVLGIVIVGIAVVAGIQAFSEGKEKAEQDAAVSDAMRIISDVQAWMLKPAAFGGGDGNPNAKVNLRSLGYNVPVGQAFHSTPTGCFELAHTGADPILSVYRGSETDKDDATECVNKIADVTIAGTGATAEDIIWSYTNQ